MGIGMRIYTWLHGQAVGEDEYGNRYYRDSGGPSVRNNGRERRWVAYRGEAEGSKVPEVWHAWLHHMTDEVPDSQAVARRPWQKPHQPNLTGTENAYRPPGSILEGGKRSRGTGDYEPWVPN